MSNLSPGTRALLRAAKSDAPSRESRSAIWGGVASGLAPMHLTSQAPPPVPAAAAAAKSTLWMGAVPATMKGAFIGALFGSALSIGVATFLLRAKPVAPVQAPVAAQASAQASAQAGASPQAGAGAQDAAQRAQGDAMGSANPNAATASTSEQIAAASRSSGNSATSGANANNAIANTSSNSVIAGNGARHGTRRTTPPENADDLLTRESALVSDAHRALLAGDAAAALKSVRAARSLEARQFEPEEMSLEGRALRALGRDAEAQRVESSLRKMYPNQTH